MQIWLPLADTFLALWVWVLVYMGAIWNDRLRFQSRSDESIFCGSLNLHATHSKPFKKSNLHIYIKGIDFLKLCLIYVGPAFMSIYNIQNNAFNLFGSFRFRYDSITSYSPHCAQLFFWFRICFRKGFQRNLQCFLTLSWVELWFVMAFCKKW